MAGIAGKVSALALAALLLSACVEHHPHREEANQALVRSWMKILSVNGSAPEDPYVVMLSPGPQQMDVLFQTYREEYLCRFEFEAVAGYSYDVVDHSNPQPLVLYRWVRVNGAWAERLDPVLPVCELITDATPAP
jgi:hypothetical protein